MELRPRKGRSGQPPSTPTVAKPSPRQAPQSASRRKPASVPSSPILIPSDDEATDPKQSHEGSSLALKQGSHDSAFSAETPLSEFVKSRRKALSSSVKPKKAASTVKKKLREVSPFAEQDTLAMKEVCIATIAVEMVRSDEIRDLIVSAGDINVGENLTDNVFRDSIELGGEKSLRKGKKMQSAKKKSAAKGGRGTEIKNREVAREVRDAKLDWVDDKEPSLVGNAPLTVNSDGCNHTLSLILSDDENAQALGDVQLDVLERKNVASTSEEVVQGQAPKASSKKKSPSKNDNFGEESLNRKLFEETAAEPDDLVKHETDMEAKLSKEEETRMDNEKNKRSEEMVGRTSSKAQCSKPSLMEAKLSKEMEARMDNEKHEKFEEMVARTSSKAQCSEPCTESLKEIDQSEIEMLENDDENSEKPDAAVAGVGIECAQNNVSEESLQRESSSGYERDEEIGNGHNNILEIKLDKRKGDAIHIEDHNNSGDDNVSDASTSDDEDEVDFASIFARSMKAHLHISEPSVMRESTEMQSEQFVQKGGKRPLTTKDAIKGSHANDSISRLGLSWSPRVVLSASKNGRPQQAGALEARPNNIWEKDRCLQDGLCVPPVDPVKLNKLARKQKKDTTGDKWYNLSAPTITPELKKELQLVKLRGVLDPKRHYKAEDSKGLPKYFQVGTVIGGPADFYSGSLTNKEQKNSLANELLSNSSLSAYRKRKFLEIQDHKQAGGKGFMKKKKSKRTPAWAKI